VLEAIEEAFDEVALAVEISFHASLHLPVSAGRDVSAAALGGDEVDQSGAVVASVADEVAAAGRPRIRAGASVLSEACPGESTIRIGRPRPSTKAWILVVSPPRERPTA